MKLLRHAIVAVGLQIFAAHLLLNIFAVNYVWFALWMAVAAHCVIEVTAMSSLERTSGFKMFILSYLVAECYLFALAVSGALYEFGFTTAYMPANFLFAHGANVMFCLTVLSLVTDSFTPILRNTGAAGDMVGRFIDRLYSTAMRLPLHQIRG